MCFKFVRHVETKRPRHLQASYLWLDMVRADNDVWYWGDSVPLDLDSINSFYFQANFSSAYPDYNCAVWNVFEPQFRRARCSEPFIIPCQISSATGGQLFHFFIFTYLCNYFLDHTSICISIMQIIIHDCRHNNIPIIKKLYISSDIFSV